MKYIETVEANIWDSSNEAQVDKIIEWLTVSVPGQFSFEDGELQIMERNLSTVYFGTTYSSPVPVKDGEALIISKDGLEKMNGRAFKAIYSLLNEED